MSGLPEPRDDHAVVMARFGMLSLGTLGVRRGDASIRVYLLVASLFLQSK